MNLSNTTASGLLYEHTSKEPENIYPDDAVWILTSAFIIFTMQSGFGLLESGLVSRKNEVSIMVKNAVDVIFGGLSYWMFGFAFSFGDKVGTNAFCGMGFFFTDADDKDMGQIYSKYFFQMSFATTATTIVSGAMAERTNLKAYTAFSFFNTLTYCFPAHWIWADDGWLKKLGAVDVAGSSAVHVVGGISGLVATIYLKPRTGIFKDNTSGKKENNMASPTNALLGTFMIWWGWLGFNCGSTFGISGNKWKLAARSAVCTINSSIGGGIASTIYSYILNKNKLIISDFVTGILGGLVGVTAICAVTKPSYALILGFSGGLVACCGCKLLEKLHIDDPVACVPVHFLSGIWSLVAVAFFVEKDESGYFATESGIINGGPWSLLGAQIVLALSVSLWSGCVTLILLIGINTVFPIRLSAEDELSGADRSEHNIWYDRFDAAEEASAFGTRQRPSKQHGIGDISAVTGNRVIDHEFSSGKLHIGNETSHSPTSNAARLRNLPNAPFNSDDGENNDGFSDEIEKNKAKISKTLDSPSAKNYKAISAVSVT